MTGALSDHERLERVDAWLDDVSQASARWKTAKAAQESSERIISYLEQIAYHMYRTEVPSDLMQRMNDAIDKNRDNASRCAQFADEMADLEGGFYAILRDVRPGALAEAWRLHYAEGFTWAQCARKVSYARQHLDKLSKRAKIDVYARLPDRYR